MASNLQAVYFLPTQLPGRWELRELRCHMGSEHYRVLYRRSERLIVLLHAFPKTTGKLPASEVKTAQKRWLDFKARMEARPRKPPRAAGRDAP